MKNRLCIAALVLYVACLVPDITNAQSPGDRSFISFKKVTGYFPLSANGKVPPVFTGETEYPGVIRAVKSLQADITTVTKTSPQLLSGEISDAKEIVLIGTIGKSAIIDKLIQQNNFN